MKLIALILLLTTPFMANSEELNVSSVDFIQYLAYAEACEILDDHRPLNNEVWYRQVINSEVGIFVHMPLYCFYLESFPDLKVGDLTEADVSGIHVWLYLNQERANYRYSIDHSITKYAESITSGVNTSESCSNIAILASQGNHKAFKVELGIAYQQYCENS